MQYPLLVIIRPVTTWTKLERSLHVCMQHLQACTLHRDVTPYTHGNMTRSDQQQNTASWAWPCHDGWTLLHRAVPAIMFQGGTRIAEGNVDPALTLDNGDALSTDVHMQDMMPCGWARSFTTAPDGDSVDIHTKGQACFAILPVSKVR
jgi:hypothetical protein